MKSSGRIPLFVHSVLLNYARSICTMFGSNIIGNLVTNGTEASTASGVLINAGSGEKNDGRTAIGKEHGSNHGNHCISGVRDKQAQWRHSNGCDPVAWIPILQPCRSCFHGSMLGCCVVAIKCSKTRLPKSTFL